MVRVRCVLLRLGIEVHKGSFEEEDEEGNAGVDIQGNRLAWSVFGADKDVGGIWK